jgi:hypothetical protein
LSDDGQKNFPKHLEFYSKNKSEKLVHLVGFIIRKCQIISVQFLRLDLQFSFKTPKYSEVLLAMTGLNYSTIAVVSLQQNVGRLCNEKAHT